MEIMNTLYNHNEVKIEEMYLKPTYLGPLYRSPVKAQVYVTKYDKDNPPPFIFPSFEIYFEVAKNIYWHNKFQAVDVDKEVSLDIYFTIYEVFKIKRHGD